MELQLATLVPAVGVFLYAALWRAVRRRTVAAPGLAQFEVMLALLTASSAGSVLWHSLQDRTATDVVLRVVTWTDLSVAPALLAFVVTRHPTAWSPALRRVALALSGVLGAVAISGAMNRAVLTPIGEPAIVDRVAAYGAVLASLAAYSGACGYLFSRFWTQRDPFERNHLKFLIVAALLILAGQLTNLVPALQRFPVDRTFAAASCAVVFFSMLRYRLFDVDLVIRRGLVDGVALLFIAPLYLAALFRLGTPEGPSASAWVLGIALLFPGALAFLVLRRRLQAVLDRLLMTHHLDPDAAMSRFASGARTAATRAEVGRLLAEICQATLECRYASVLLVDDNGVLQTVVTKGAFAGIRPDVTIRVENPVLQAVAGLPVPATPFEVMRLLGGDIATTHRAEIAPLADCILQAITSADGVLGLIAIADPLYQRSYSVRDLTLLANLADQAVLALESTHLLEQAHVRANTDFLTGLPNHRRLQDLLDAAVHEGQDDRPFAVAMVDVDNFKLLNDTRGHIAGDEALRSIGSFLRKSLDADCVVGRYGGDEFLLILPGMDREASTELLTFVARRARSVSLPILDGEVEREALPVRLSWGVSVFPDDGRAARMLVGAADSDLLRRRYMRRRSGQLHTSRPSLEGFGAGDPRRVRVASGLLDLLDAKDPYTTEHSQQVASLGLLLAEELALPEPDRQMLWLGGLLHDVGKLGVPEEVIRKPGGLTDQDWAEIRRHPEEGRRLIEGLFNDPRLAEIVACHHERFDGKGYPNGLVGDEIPYLARAISVADAFSAMVHDRPYRKGLLPAEALLRLQEGAGTQWDAHIVSAFTRAMTGSTRELATAVAATSA